ncbi:hypothetical protein EB796_002535 [Bugula neritina]|uniref:Receptor ligand binding region domain-containing protein n=1 Tax=Bugula neritina TaxID=10212 RepID=A0A7J7KLX4_BUGNE|nr:hypothetical protein EB796_002535 [Bugula neritina]
MTTLWPDVSVPVVFMGEINLPAALPSNVFVASVQLSQRAKAIAELAAKLNFDYVSVAHSSDSMSKELKNLLEKELRDHSVCVEEYLEIPGDDETGTVDKIIKKGKTRATILVSMAKTTTINLLNNDDESMHWIVSTQADISIEANYQKDKVYVVRHSNDSQTPHISKLESVLQLQSETAKRDSKN